MGGGPGDRQFLHLRADVGFVAIAFPFQYRSIAFTHRKAYAIIAIIAAIYAVYSSVFLIDGCDFFYSHEFAKWQYGAKPCAQFFASYVDFYYNTSVTVAFTVIDILTIARLRCEQNPLTDVPGHKSFFLYNSRLADKKCRSGQQ
ncbi:hypothetical protein TELCIR_09906 [Teladorsagia circumcincta]|uniref:7TM GPCR serpentine receptor class x (Srx) domain-containing protein n=1 Tax=Teladorsagia circumcincta TaxID=45464 RepID=A0A2G9UFQ1_TELCI|nr:hypothetical protein TELCIR_09906 [Teladorsagia circumcincta]